MTFQTYLHHHNLTVAQFHGLPDTERVSIHRDWLAVRDRPDWPSRGWTALQAVLAVIVTAVVIRVVGGQ